MAAAQGDRGRSGETGSVRFRRPVELDSCGLGFVADRRGVASHRIVAMGLEALSKLAHRGGIGADGESGDGAGLLLQLPRRLLVDELHSAGVSHVDPRRLALGMVFLPTDRGATAAAMKQLEHEVVAAGLHLLLWREVPMDLDALGSISRASAPLVRQLVLEAPTAFEDEALERELYLLRRRFQAWAEHEGSRAYVVSLSHRTVVYKGMAVPGRLAALYPDLGDPRLESAVALFHLRFSTNTRPSWRLAQPFRMLAHNGEINTIEGNANWMRARERELASPVWGERIPELLPVLEEAGSDSACLDNALELLVRSGRHIEHALAMLVPPAPDPRRDPETQAFFDFHSTLLEPWDGPAALVACDGRHAIAALDRNGLRPMRVWVTDELVVVGSESGLVELPEAQIERRERLGPGQLLSVDLESGALSLDSEVKGRWARHRPWKGWLDEQLIELPEASYARDEVTPVDLLRQQQTFGYSQEVLERLLDPMGLEGTLPIASMGDDTPPALLSHQPQLLYRYFKQRFAQVTNPAIDSLRERSAFSLEMMVGPWACLLDEHPEAARQIRCRSAIISGDQLGWLRTLGPHGLASATLDASFRVGEDPAVALEDAVGTLCQEAERAVDDGAALLIVSDRLDDLARQSTGEPTQAPTRELARAPIPMLLAVSAVHHHLIRRRKRMQVAIVADSGEPREDHHIACLIGFGASLVHPWLALASVAARAAARGLDPGAAERRLCGCLEEGLVKIMAKQGVCALSSYQGAQLFEALGIDAELVDSYFPGTPNRVGGVGFERIAADAAHRQERGREVAELGDRGLFRFRREGEIHALRPAVVRHLQRAVRSNDPAAFEAYLAELASGPPSRLRDLLEIEPLGPPLSLDEVEPAEALFARFCTAAMSHGAISRETHEALAIAMNRIGGRSNSGEGGELEVRDQTYQAPPQGFVSAWRPNVGENARSAIRQIASARFGVSARYLAGGRELEIKISQGSKPGEGGQIPGNKVTVELGALRHAPPGTPLISPPPHHDIYSIEDLAELIFDLRRVNPDARIGVKLVSSVGVGTVAAGVVKAGADVVLIAGDSGGTGASPLSSIRHAGLPWELGLAETHSVLLGSGLRHRVRLRVDGGLATGRDLVIAAVLGADELGFGTVPLIALGCVMARQCHLDTCPVGIATQRPELRERFPGAPEHVISLFGFLAEEVRRHLARLGCRGFDELVGRRDLLRRRPGGEGLATGLLEALGAQHEQPASVPAAPRPHVDPGLDDRIWRELGARSLAGAVVRAQFQTTNRDRAIGARLAGALAQRHDLEPKVELGFHGTAGQSFGAFLVDGMRFELEGEAQDGLGKGMSGGEIVVRCRGGVIAGNAVLYGATGGRLFAAGRVGERFAVRNSGAVAVVEGCGDHGCEYQTAGEVAVLGAVGQNFGAGMSGGLAFVWDPEDVLSALVNAGSVTVGGLDSFELHLQRLIRTHQQVTGSVLATRLLEEWEREREHFRLVKPRDSGRPPDP